MGGGLSMETLFHSDTPAKEDRLRRIPFARALSRLILDAQTPLTIGVYGGWGTGKTTLMDFVADELDKAAALPVRFNAWEHQLDDATPVALMHEMVDQFGMSKSETAKKCLLTAACAFGSALLKVTTTMSLGDVDAIGKRLEEERFGVREARVGLRRNFQALIDDALGNSGGRVVFFIDDLDRCTPMRAVSLLESLKLYLDLPGCVFVIGVDPTSLSVQIAERASEFGQAEDFIDKIIQLPIQLPPPTEQAIEEYVKGLLPKSLKAVARPIKSALGANPRQVKRFINVFLLSHMMASSVVDEDSYEPRVLLLYLLLQYRVPGLYRLLVLEPGLLADLAGSTEEAATYRKEYSTEFLAGFPGIEAALASESVRPEQCLPEYIHLTQVAGPSEVLIDTLSGIAGAKTTSMGAALPRVGVVHVDSAQDEGRFGPSPNIALGAKTPKRSIDIFPESDVSRIHDDLTRRLGSSIKIKANMGRSKIIERVGVLEQVHPALFVVQIKEKQGRSARVSYSYVDILTGTVQVTFPDTGEGLFDWLN